MKGAMPEGHSAALPSTVPKLLAFTVPMSAKGKIIGPAGKTIKGLIEEFGVNDISLNDDRVTISGFDADKMEACKAKVEALALEAGSGPRRKAAYEGPMPELGAVFKKCEVVSVKNFGVFVKLGDDFPGLEGLVHISELHTERIRNIAGFVSEGQVIDVKVLGLSDDGKLKLSRKATISDDA